MTPLQNNFVLFVPHWIARVMDREKLSYNVLFNLDSLKKHFSLEDLSVLYWMNNENDIFANSQYMMESSLWTSAKEIEYIHNSIIPMKAIAKDAIAARIKQDEGSGFAIDGSVETLPFKIVNIADKASVFVVVQYPGGSKTHQFMLVTELLKLLYAHAGYDSMASSQLFKGYIENLALVNNQL